MTLPWAKAADKDWSPSVLTRRDQGIRQRTLILIRWIAIFGQTTTILFVHFFLHYECPIVPILGVVAVSVLINLYLSLRYPASKRLSETGAALQLVFDSLQIAVLLFLSGGLHNPFSFLMFGPVVISATVLPRRITLLLIGMVIIISTVLVFVHLPLPWPKGEILNGHIYVAGLWSALVIGMIFFSANLMRVAEEGRRMTDALTETQMILMREQHLSAFGGSVAVAAHELGTPLGTISVVTKELLHELPEDGPYTEDLKLLAAQSDRCRDIFQRMTRHSSKDNHTSLVAQPLVDLVKTVVQSKGGGITEVTVEPDTQPTKANVGNQDAKVEHAIPQPIMFNRLELIKGLENIIENAVDFAGTRVSVTVGWSEELATVSISDDGPGFPRNVLYNIGEPYISTRGGEGGLGLGLFIAKVLLERTGADIEFGNHIGGGARVKIVWQRAMLGEVPQSVKS